MKAQCRAVSIFDVTFIYLPINTVVNSKAYCYILARAFYEAVSRLGNGAYRSAQKAQTDYEKTAVCQKPTPSPTQAPTEGPTPFPSPSPTPVCEETTIIDFDTDGHGNPNGAGDDPSTIYQNVGLIITTNTGPGKPPMLFDTGYPTGGDFDLSSNEGLVLIISEDGDPTDPDDNARGGTITFTWSTPVCYGTIRFLDIEKNGKVKLFDENDDLISTHTIPKTGNGKKGTYSMTLTPVV